MAFQPSIRLQTPAYQTQVNALTQAASRFSGRGPNPFARSLQLYQSSFSPMQQQAAAPTARPPIQRPIPTSQPQQPAGPMTAPASYTPPANMPSPIRARPDNGMDIMGQNSKVSWMRDQQRGIEYQKYLEDMMRKQQQQQATRAAAEQPLASQFQSRYGTGPSQEYLTQNLGAAEKLPQAKQYEDYFGLRNQDFF